MKNLLKAGKMLLLDMASTLFFLALYLLTHNIPLAIVLGVVLGIAQIGWEALRKRPIDTMQWLSLGLVVASGAATLLTNDPRFVMVKPSIIYAIVGAVMLKPGWMNRYMPPIVQETVGDVAFIFGYVWAGLMFCSAGVNLVIALHFSVAFWASFMSAYGIATKLGLFLVQYAVMRFVGRRRYRARAMPALAVVS